MRSSVFVKAAKRTATGKEVFCFSWFLSKEEKFFESIFGIDDYWGPAIPDERLARSLALLLCAEIIGEEHE